ncbi:unnamed protein product [Allacma fusca]|uniref:Uncharacterized protein n=1 Tax=Allacma fusca TaxID=39272 RepID=A0A8J2PJV8_9HEXA|nr:unnamed protein product [Allacma fusca]
MYFLKTVLVGIVCVVIVTNTVAEWKAIENPCLCQQFRCNQGGICLHAQRACDGNKDCPGGEDERNNFTVRGKCYRKKMKCTDDQFPCKFGDCILLTQVCDGIIDCWGAVDESSDFCEWVHSNNTS